MTNLDHRELTARKPHQCAECCHTIEPGTRYVRQRNVDGGDAWTYKAHVDCFDVAMRLDMGRPLDWDRVHVLDHEIPPAVRARLEAAL